MPNENKSIIGKYPIVVVGAVALVIVILGAIYLPTSFIRELEYEEVTVTGEIVSIRLRGDNELFVRIKNANYGFDSDDRPPHLAFFEPKFNITNLTSVMIPGYRIVVTCIVQVDRDDDIQMHTNWREEIQYVEVDELLAITE